MMSKSSFARKDGWEEKKLGDVCKFKSGQTIPETLEMRSGEIIYVKVGDLNLPKNEESIITSSRFVNFDSIKNNQIIPIGSVIFPKRGGAIATNKKRKIVKPIIIDVNIMAVIPSNRILPDYLYYWFQNIDLDTLSNGTSIPQINNNSFDNVYIHFPASHSEQKQIVETLDKAFKAIDKAKANIEKNIENARELCQSRLNEFFSQKGENWEEKTLVDLIDIKHGYAFRSENFKTEFIGTKPIVLTPGNFSDDSTLNFTEQNTKRCYGEFPESFKFNVGDLVLVMTDLSSKMKILGKPAIIETENILHNQRIGKIRFKDNKINRDFLYFFFQTDKYLNEIKNSATGTMVKHTAPKRILSNILVYPKSLEEQKEIVKKTENMNSVLTTLQKNYLQKLNNLEELKKLLLQKAFAGELT